MLAATKTQVTQTQSDGVLYIKGAVVNEFAALTDIAGAAKYFTNFTQEYKDIDNVVMTKESLTEIIASGSSVTIARGWYPKGRRTGGHVTVVYGYYYEGTQLMLRIRDPWPENETPWPVANPGQTKIMTYEDVVDGRISGYDTGVLEGIVY
jgi:hypothetical protein